MTSCGDWWGVVGTAKSHWKLVLSSNVWTKMWTARSATMDNTSLRPIIYRWSMSEKQTNESWIWMCENNVRWPCWITRSMKRLVENNHKQNAAKKRIVGSILLFSGLPREGTAKVHTGISVSKEAWQSKFANYGNYRLRLLFMKHRGEHTAKGESDGVGDGLVFGWVQVERRLKLVCRKRDTNQHSVRSIASMAMIE